MQREHGVQSGTGVCQESKTCPFDFHDGGYFTFNNGQAVAHYYIQDHQGNIRAVVDSDNHVEQINHYYPFGAVYSDAGTNDAIQRYKYNGKELDRMHGLNQYDYGARQYDPLLCRFTQIDPLCEKYYDVSPYAYCGNSPINRIDPNGKDWRITVNSDQNGIMHYNITVTGVLYNNSSQKLDMNKLNDMITEQIESAFTFSDDGYDVSMNADIRVVDNIDDINSSDHVFQVVNQSILADGDKGVLADADITGLNIRLGTKLVGDVIAGNNIRTIAHELGHTGGLEHTVTGSNLMTQTKDLQIRNINLNSATKLTRVQIESINSLYKNGKLNNRSPIYTSFRGFGLKGFPLFTSFPVLKPIFKKGLRK